MTPLVLRVLREGAVGISKRLVGYVANLVSRVFNRLVIAAVVYGAYRVGHLGFTLAVKFDTTNYNAVVNRSLVNETLGQWVDAWRDAEARLRVSSWPSLYRFSPTLPRWGGEPLFNGELLIHWEQGYGDIVQYARFLPMAAARAGAVAFECPPPLLAFLSCLQNENLRFIGALETGPVGEAYENCVAYAPLASLPFLLGLSGPELVPPPYLRSTIGMLGSNCKSKVGAWDDERTRSCAEGPRIAWIWRGGDFDTARTATVEDAAPLVAAGFGLDGAVFGATADEASWLSSHQGRCRSCEIRHFADLAKILLECDAVVTIDTAAAHVAGALGLPTWLLLNDPCAPRWGIDADRTAWYPSLQLARKARRESWLQLVSRVAVECMKYLSKAHSGNRAFP